MLILPNINTSFGCHICLTLPLPCSKNLKNISTMQRFVTDKYLIFRYLPCLCKRNGCKDDHHDGDDVIAKENYNCNH